MMFRRKKKSCWARAAAVTLGLTALNTAAAGFFYEWAFRRRIDYASAEQMTLELERNPDIVCDPYSFVSKEGNRLLGYFYSQAKPDAASDAAPGVSPGTSPSAAPKGLIILAHGFGPGHTPYLDLLINLVRRGFIVYGFDNTGVGDSEGSSVLGFAHAPIDLLTALAAVRNHPRAQGLPILFYGHSWGAWSVLTALHEQPEIAGAVAVSAPNSSPGIMISHSRRIAGPAATLLLPGAALYERLRIGAPAWRTGAGGVAKAPNTPVLVAHARNDDIVPFADSALRALLRSGGKYRHPNATIMDLADGGHLFYVREDNEIRNLSFGIMPPEVLEKIAAFLLRAASQHQTVE